MFTSRSDRRFARSAGGPPRCAKRVGRSSAARFRVSGHRDSTRHSHHERHDSGDHDDDDGTHHPSTRRHATARARRPVIRELGRARGSHGGARPRGRRVPDGSDERARSSRRVARGPVVRDRDRVPEPARLQRPHGKERQGAGTAEGRRRSRGRAHPVAGAFVHRTGSGNTRPTCAERQVGRSRFRGLPCNRSHDAARASAAI